MLNDAEEAVDMLRSGTGALLVNLGTVTREQGAAMQTAVREANRLNIPWVLDPVAVGALSLRTRLAGQLKEQSPASSAETLLKSWPWPAIPPSRKGRKAPAPAQTPCMRPGNWPCTRGGRARYGAYGLFHRRPPGNRHGKWPRHDVPGHGRGLFHGSPVRRPRRRLPTPCGRPFPRPYSWALPEKWPLNKAPPRFLCRIIAGQPLRPFSGRRCPQSALSFPLTVFSSPESNSAAMLTA